MDDEENLKKLLQIIYKSVTPSPGFRERLLRQLTLEVSRQAEPVRPRLWLKPVFWAPATALVAMAVIGYFVLLPLLSTPVSPPITAPSITPPASSPAPTVTSPPPESMSPPPVIQTSPPPAEPVPAPPVTPPAPAPSPIPTPEPETAPAPSPAPTPPAESVNFRLLISDEVNAIDHFASLNVTISSIGMHEAGDPGTWQTFDLDTPANVDLKPLKGENAQEIWSGQLAEGEYTKVFIYVDNVTGILEGGGEADVKLPSNKLQISMPFTIGESLVNFVYDITVVEAGESGKYILKPQVDQSGPDQTFKLVTPEGAGKPEKADTDEDEPEETESLKITITRFPHGQIGVDYTATVEATGGSGSYTWSISEGGLPDGLNLDSATGLIAGIPTTAGKYDFTVRVEDESDPEQSDTRKLSIQIKD